MSHEDNVQKARIRLLKIFDHNESGIWVIEEEDGCMGRMPTKEYVKGKYSNVVEYALSNKSFFAYGGGGNIFRFNNGKEPKNVDFFFSPEAIKLRQEKEDLEKRLAEITAKLGK